ncbi:3-hydroxybutyryl-CoA dehydrogenase [Carnobacterium sp. PL24RED07]|uniref:3-hydroxybutyryl-CoA dehydrogenase n=1 Tax=Aerococcus viridans TaxID=1377 RepID=A0A2J9PL14_9LACT|nr:MULTISPECIES: 3-hydroxybutyryl-CoA dehydrogenase [Lactobacillales]KAF3301648.1 3-hydroxybutyryl-CoA dehydrogenase [Carnobacterium sp. PL26RED25]KAF3305657.1 3-hydroxybutyryl-CoA dehydrogenase [Carnobacterium sp. PL24RED07]PNL91034.1 3-hydroxybutyryl-CoA dehydrogenase [Aerococcus viridans]
MEKVFVIGAGQMGGGIAQVFAQAGYTVVLNDIKQEFVDRGLAKIEKGLARRVEKGKMSQEEVDAILAKITTSTSYDDAKDVDLIIEAATENEKIKLDIFRQLDEIAKEDTILATNTSSLSVTKIGAVTKRPDKVIGLHFFNPVPAMKLIELNIGIKTSLTTVEAMKQVSEALGKEAVEVKDSPGFVVNRVLIPMINEAIFILDSGVASAEEIDTAMKLGASHPMGPLALGDLIGLDTVLAIMNTLYDGYKDPKYRPAPLLVKYVEAGQLGRKTGQGFFSYE